MAILSLMEKTRLSILKFQVNNFSDIWKKRVNDIDQGNIRKYNYI